MAVTAFQIAIPSSGSAVKLFSSTADNSNNLSIRNTGSVTVLLGPSGDEVFPLAANEFLGVEVTDNDALYAQVQTAGTAGQITVLGMG